MKRSSTIFHKGEEAPRIAGRKGRKVSPWNVKFNANAIRTMRERNLETIKRVARELG